MSWRDLLSSVVRIGLCGLMSILFVICVWFQCAENCVGTVVLPPDRFARVPVIVPTNIDIGRVAHCEPCGGHYSPFMGILSLFDDALPPVFYCVFLLCMYVSCGFPSLVVRPIHVGMWHIVFPLTLLDGIGLRSSCTRWTQHCDVYADCVSGTTNVRLFLLGRVGLCDMRVRVVDV